MYSRSEIRHACYRAKNGAVTEKNKSILALIEPLLQHNYKWENFSIEWDVIVTRDKQIKLIKPERDYDFVHKALLKASLYDEMSKPFDDLEDRERNIVIQVESLLLDKIMTWKNYNTVWGVELDKISNVIKTKMYGTTSSQIEVTPEMITASMKDADGSAMSDKRDGETVLEMKPMTDAQRKAFEEFLAKKNTKA